MARFHTAQFITPVAPFDLAQTLRFLGMFTPTAGEQTLQDAHLKKAILVGGQTLLFDVTSVGTVEAPRLHCAIRSEEPISAGTQAVVVDRVQFFLSAQDDVKPFYAQARRDPALWPLVEDRYGFHQPKFLTPFEIASWAVMTQRTPIPVARKFKDAFVARFGAALEDDGVVYPAFPTPDRVVGASAAELAALVKNERKGLYLHAIADAFLDVDEAFLRTAPVEEVQTWLCNIPGIGAWSSAFILIRGLGRMEWLDAGESRVSNVVSMVYNGGRPLAEREVQRIADGYGAHKGYWALHLRAAEQSVVRKGARSHPSMAELAG